MDTVDRKDLYEILYGKSTNIAANETFDTNKEFKLTLPDQLATFQEFVETAKPVLNQIEAHLASNFNLASPKNSGANNEKEDLSNEQFTTATQNRNLLHVYGALLKEILVLEVNNDHIMFRMNKTNDETLDLEEIFGASNLEEKRLLLTLERNNLLDTAIELDEELLQSLLSKMLQNEITFSQGDSKSALIENVLGNLDSRLNQLLSDNRHSQTQEPMKFTIGGSFGISKLEGESCNTMDIENAGSELNARLLAEYNNPDEYCKKLPLGFTENIITNKTVSDASFYAVLLLQVVFSRRLAKTEKALSEQKAIEDLLETAKFVPFPSGSVMNKLQTKLTVAKALDSMLEPEVEKLLQQSDCRTETQKSALKKLCSDLTSLYYDQNCLISTLFFKKLGAYKNNIELFINTESNTSEEAKMSEHGTSVSKSEKLESFKGNEEEDEELERMMLEEDDEDLAENTQKRSALKNRGLESQKDMIEENQQPNINDMEEEQPVAQEKSISQVQEDSPLEGNFSSEDSPIKEKLIQQPIPQQTPLVVFAMLQNPVIEHPITHKDDLLASNLLKGLVTSKDSKIPADAFETPMKGILTKGNNKIAAPEINSTACKTSTSKLMAPSINSTLEKSSIIQKELSSRKEKVVQNLTESMMTEEKPKYLEDQLSRKMRQLRSKMTLSEAEKKLEELQDNPMTNQSAISAITEGMKAARAWKSRYQETMLKQTRNPSKIRDLADELEHVTVRVDEMESFLEEYIQRRIWKDRLTNATRILKKPKASLSQTMDLEEDATGYPKPHVEMLSLQELHEIINESHKFDLDEQEETQVKELKNKAIQARNLEERVIENTEGVYDVNILVSFENDIKNLKIKLPQFETIQARIMINREVSDLLNKEVSIDQIERFFDKYPDQTNEVHTDSYYQLNRKYEEAKKLQQNAKSLVITKTTFEFSDVQLARETLSEAENLKVHFDETKDLRNIMRSFTWLMRVYSMIEEDSIKASNYESLFSSKLDMSLPAFETENIINQCRAFLEDKSEKARKLSWLRLAVDEGETIRMADSRIEQLYSDFSLQLWRNESENFIGKKRSSRELERFLYDAPDVLMDKMDEETLQVLRDELAKIKEWRALYQSVIDPFIEDYIRTKLEKDLNDPVMKDKVMDLRWKLTKLSTEYSVDLAKYPDLEQNYSIVQKYLTWTTLAIQVAEISSKIEEGVKAVSYTELKELHSAVTEHNIPTSVEFCKKIEDWYNHASETLKTFRNKFEHLKPKSEPMTVFNLIEKDSMKKTIERNKNRPTVVDALKIKYVLEGANSFVSFTDEINALVEMVEKYEDWRMKLDAFMVSDERLTESAKDESHAIEDYEQIGKDINYLKAEFVCLELHSEEDEKKLMSLDWQYRAYLLMKKLNTNPTANEFKKLLGYASDDPEIDPTQEKIFTKFLEEEAQNCKKASKLIKELIQNKWSEELKTLEDLEELYAQLRNSYMRLEEDEKTLEELISKCKKLVTRANYLSTTTEKEPIIEFTKTLDQIKHLPITLQTEVEMLERHINDANKLVSTVRKNPSMDLAAVEKLIDEYKHCPVMITDAQRLQDNYENSRKAYQKIQSDLQKMVFKSDTLAYDEIWEMSQKVDEVNWDYDGQLTYTKMQVYVLKIGYLKRAKPVVPDAEGNNSQTIALYNLRSLVAEGRDLKKEIYDSRSLDESLFWIENILRQAEEKVNELKKINSIETLERVPSVLFNFLDLSQEIIEIKAALLAPKVEEPSKNNSQQTFPRFSQNLYNPEIDISSFNTSKSKSEKKGTKNKREKEDSRSPDPLDPLIKLLQKSKNLRLSELEAITTAAAIAKSFPEITTAQTRMKKFVTTLKKIVSHPNIASHLLIKDFAKRELVPLMKESEESLLLIEERYAQDPNKRSDSLDLEPDLTKKTRTGYTTDQLENYFTQLQSQEPAKNRKTNNVLRESGIIDRRRMPNRDNGRQPPGKNNRFRNNFNRENKRPFNRQRDYETADATRQEFSDEEMTNSNTLSNNLALREQKELATKRNKIPYDPEDEEDMLARELRMDNPSNNYQEMPSSTSPAEESAIFRVFKGMLKAVNDKISPKIGMYSSSPIDTIREIPQIIDERSDILRIQGKLSLQKFEAYMREFSNLFNEKDQFIIAGWIEADSLPHQQSCERIANDFLQDNSVGITRYLDCAKIFFIHKDQMPAEWVQKLDFRIQKVEQSVNPPSLAFVLIFQPAKASFDTSLLKRIVPEPQKPYQEPIRNSQFAEEQKSLNPRQRSTRGLSDLVTGDEPILGGAYKREPTFNFIKKYQQGSAFSQSFKENQMTEANLYEERHQPRVSQNASFNNKNEFSRMELEQPVSQNTSRGGFQYSQNQGPFTQSQRSFPQNQQRQNQAPRFSAKPYDQGNNFVGGNRNPSAQRGMKMPGNLQKYLQGPQGASTGRPSFPRQQHNTNSQQMYPSNSNKSFQSQAPKTANSFGGGFVNQNRNKFGASQGYDNSRRPDSYNARSQSRGNTAGNNFANTGNYSQQQQPQRSYSKNEFNKNLLNIPLKNLNTQDEEEYRPYQSSNQMRGFDKYPSYKSSSQNMSTRW